MGHVCLVCTHFIFTHLMEGWVLQVPFSLQRVTLDTLTISLSLTTTLSVEETLMNFGCTYAPNLIHQGASVITEISSTNGYRNPTSSKSYEVTHGPQLPQNHFQKVQNYTTSDKIKVHYDYTGRARTCAIQKCRKSTHVHDARLWSLKVVHT